jgi:hypothetical protein
MKQSSTTAWMYFGMTVGLIVSYTSKTPIKLETIIFFGFLTIMTIPGNFFDFLRLLFITSLVIVTPFNWSNGHFSWYQPIFFIWGLVSIFYTIFVFEKKNKTVFVLEGDVLTFPPTFVEDDYQTK